MMSIQRYIHTAFGEMKAVSENPPAFDGGWVKSIDHEREVAELKATLAKRESLLDKMTASNDRLLTENERLKARVIITDDELLTLNEKYGYFQFADAQGSKSRAFANDISTLIVARAAEGKPECSCYYDGQSGTRYSDMSCKVHTHAAKEKP